MKRKIYTIGIGLLLIFNAILVQSAVRLPAILGSHMVLQQNCEVKLWGKERFLATIEPWHGNEVAVYRERKGVWEREVIDSTLVDGHTLVVADLDGNGQAVILAGYRGKGASVNLYRWDGQLWVKSVLDNGGMAAAGCAVGDLNGDGRLDVACVGTSTANLKWYESTR